MKNLFVVFALLCLTACDNDGTMSSHSAENSFDTVGQGGSLARFTISDDHLYTVDENSLNVFDISNPENPVKVNEVNIGFNIETLSAFKKYLFIGSRNGMYIYDINSPEQPTYLSEARHFTACDPVISDGVYAYVTLHADIGCGTDVNRLEIYDVTSIENPVLISARNLTKPIGIGLYGDYLFVCDDEVKVFDVTDPANTSLATSINIDAYDVIVYGDLLILIGDDGLHQYSLNPDNIQDIRKLSYINV